MKNSSPIIFIHYGDAEFLKYTLGALKITNPLKRIILLGDTKNQYLGTQIGIEHYLFDNYNTGKEIELFNKVFKVIKGELHNFNKTNGVDYWTKFVFKRWFNLYNFILEQNINSFWTFDSDNLIFENLEKHEDLLSKYDNTEQCKGSCMNGFVSNINTVKNYIDTINKLFQNEDYIAKQQQDFSINTNYAFTEMRAYDEYKKSCNPKTIRLGDVYLDKYFDDCICFENDMEMTTLKNGKQVKQVYLGNNGKVFIKSILTNKLIPCINLNMSWVSNRLIYRLYNHIKKKPIITSPVAMNMEDEFFYKLSRRIVDRVKSIFTK